VRVPQALVPLLGMEKFEPIA